MKYKLDREGSILGGVEVTYKGKKYTTGNRYHDLVELWKDGKPVKIGKFLKNYTFRKLT